MLNLKELRTEKDIFQKDIAKALNCTVSCVSSWEKGITQPSIDNLSQLADFFNCSVDYLIGRENEDGRIINAAPQLSSDEQELLDGFRQLNPAAQLLVRGYAKGMLSAPYITKKSN